MLTLLLVLETLVFPFAAAGVLLAFLLSPRRGVLNALSSELAERFGRPALPAFPSAPVWIHCASAGEVNAAAALIARLADRGLSVVVTTATAAGRERARGVKGVSAAVLAPLDAAPIVASFLSRARPKALLVVETELWPAMIALAARRMPVCVVNARLTERSARRYVWLAPFMRALLSRVKLVCAQTEDEAARWRSLGAPRVEVCGNMKFDLPGAAVPTDAVRAAFARLGWGESPVIVAGSTHPGEEQAVVGAYLRAKKAHPALKLAIAPRHLERADDCARTLSIVGVAFCRWSAMTGGADAVLVDAMGVLSGLYGLGVAGFVGGTLVPVGGHNLLEPALAGVPVLFGPHTHHQAQSARLLESAGGGFCAADGERLGDLLKDLLDDPDRARAQGALAQRTARSLQGAVDRTDALLRPFLP